MYQFPLSSVNGLNEWSIIIVYMVRTHWLWPSLQIQVINLHHVAYGICHDQLNRVTTQKSRKLSLLQ